LFFDQGLDLRCYMDSVLVDHGTLVIYSEAATAAAAASKKAPGLWSVRFSPDTKSIATGGRDGQIKVCIDVSRKSLLIDVAGLFRFGRLNANDYAPSSRNVHTSLVSTFRLMVVSSLLLPGTVRFVRGPHGMARRSI
jgi:WD40 repeat protein